MGPTESSPPDIAVMDSLPADWESELEATTCTRTIPTRPTLPSTPSPTTRTTTHGPSRTTSACSGSPTAPTSAPPSSTPSASHPQDRNTLPEPCAQSPDGEPPLREEAWPAHS